MLVATRLWLIVMKVCAYSYKALVDDCNGGVFL